MTETRTERDPLGPLEVPADAYFGVQTQRAINNFPISGRRPDIALVRAAVQVKKAAARANGQTGRLEPHIAAAIIQAADEILGLALNSTTDEGRARQATLIDNFRVDPFQAGAGVSHNMNTNEVLANRAIEILATSGFGNGQRGDYSVVNPNDHVNMAQSTNDTFPTAMRIATLDRVAELLPVLDELADAFAERGVAFDNVLKSGRTHMQDAVPIRLGQEFNAYALTVRRARNAIAAAADGLLEQNIGATAVGTGLNAEPEYIRPGRPAAVRTDRPRAPTGGAACPCDSIDGADARGFRRASRIGRGPGQDLRGPAPHVIRATHRLCRDQAAAHDSRARRSCPAR